ncbi:uncharacterized protein LOC109846007 [Asparagus officinalis]|uniref:uncharacterized protein LOC109846007 n=1 Tax=Asparagus officinalis TaxID=4686 RepID=UPI00098E2781|nr:uncharacterized protein LOC109846007 [Asparagus officinalis]
MSSMDTRSIIESHRPGAEVYTGAALCRQKALELHDKFHLPRGLLPPVDLDEVGYNQSTGFVWMRLKKATTHKNKKIGQLTSYGQEVTAFIEDWGMRRMTGVKSKEMFVWMTISEFFIHKRDPGMITFKSALGLSKSLPVAVFEEELADEEGGK